MYDGHIILRVNDPAQLCIYFINVNPLHSILMNLPSFFYVHCYRLDVRLLAHPLIRTSPCSIPCIHHLYVIRQHRIICHDVTVLHATVLVSALSLHLSLCRSIRHQLALWISSYDTISVIMTLCIIFTSELLYLCSCTVILPCALRGTLLRCPVRPRVIIMVYSSCFSVTYCYYDDILLGRVDLQVIALSPRWCCIPDLHGHCYIFTVLTMMTCCFQLLLPIMDYEYLSCHLCR